MKMESRTRTVGTPIARAVRSFARSSRNGSGTRLLELGVTLSSSEPRTTEFATAGVAEPAPQGSPAPVWQPMPVVTYGPAQWARPSFTHGFPGSAFTPQPDGTLLCPATHPLYPQERRSERDGSLRVLYAARIGHCRSCPLRAQCQESPESRKPRRVSAVFWPLEASRTVSPPPRENGSPLLRWCGKTGHVVVSGENG